MYNLGSSYDVVVTSPSMLSFVAWMWIRVMRAIMSLAWPIFEFAQILKEEIVIPFFVVSMGV